MKAETSFNEYEKSKKGEAVKKNRGPVKRVTVEPTAEGIMTTAEHEDMSSGHEAMMYGHDRVKKHHKGKDAAHKAASHISKLFGGKQMVPVGPEAKEESAEAGAGDPNEGAEKE